MRSVQLCDWLVFGELDRLGVLVWLPGDLRLLPWCCGDEACIIGIILSCESYNVTVMQDKE